MGVFSHLDGTSLGKDRCVRVDGTYLCVQPNPAGRLICEHSLALLSEESDPW